MDIERIHGVIAEGVKAPAVACSLSGELLYMNPAAEQFCGCSLADVVGKPCRELLLDFPLSPATSPSALSHPTSFESRIRTPGGEEKRVHVALLPTRGQAGASGFVMMLEDMHDSQQLLEALRESETRYRALVENMLNGLVQYRVVLDDDGQPVDAIFCEANLAFEKITGIKREAVIGMRVTEFRPDVDREWVELIGQVALTGVPVRFERHSVRLGKWFAMLAYRPREGYCAIVSEDVTERVLMMEALRDSEARYRELVESANSVIVKIDAQGHITFLNDFAYRFFGVKEDLAGRSVVGTLVPPEEFSAEQLEQELQRASEHPDDFRDLEWSCAGPKGRRQWLSLSLRFIHDEQGRMVSVLAFGNDVTARKEAQEALAESEEEFRALFDNASDGIFILSESREFLEVNQVLCRRLGTPRETLLNTPPDVIYGTGFVASLHQKVEAVEGDEPAVLEATETARDGAALAVEMSARRLSYHGQPAVLGVVRDISERRRVEDAQRLAALGQLSAGVAHEFNNLLGAMMIKAEMAGYQQTPEQYEELVELVVRSCRRGAEVCQNLVAFASPRELQRQPLHIEEPIEAALAITVRQMANADIVVKRDYLSVGRRVLVDPGQLEQVFLNLFINACHAMPTGGTLAIKTRHAGSGGEEQVIVTVSDTGGGISGDLLPRVFEPFFTTKGRLGQSDTPGSGLGLSVSHGIVKAHGGSITVRSDPDQGTCFTVVLPVRQEVAGEAERDRGAPELPGGPPGEGARVLVAEDELDIANLLAQVLRDRGYQVVTAAATDEALRALEDQRFDLIVADWLMPGGGGRRIVARAQRLTDSPPIVIVTGKLGLELLEELEPNIVCCLQKPFHLAELLQVISQVLER